MLEFLFIGAVWVFYRFADFFYFGALEFPDRPSVRLSVCLFEFFIGCSSFFLSVQFELFTGSPSFFISVHLSFPTVRPSVRLSVCLYVCLSIPYFFTVALEFLFIGAV